MEPQAERRPYFWLTWGIVVTAILLLLAWLFRFPWDLIWGPGAP